MKIIFIKSEDRCGKDTTAEIIEEEYLSRGMSASILPLGDSLKSFVADNLSISYEELDLLKNNNFYVNIDGEDILTRDYIIKTSEDLKRNFGDDLFARHVANIMDNDPKDIIIIPGIRFDVEYKRLCKYDNIVIEILSNRKECGSNNKKYELDIIPSDFTILNDTTKEDLKINILNLLKNL